MADGKGSSVHATLVMSTAGQTSELYRFGEAAPSPAAAVAASKKQQYGDILAALDGLHDGLMTCFKEHPALNPAPDPSQSGIGVARRQRQDDADDADGADDYESAGESDIEPLATPVQENDGGSFGNKAHRAESTDV